MVVSHGIFLVRLFCAPKLAVPMGNCFPLSSYVPPVYGSTQAIPAYYSFLDPKGCMSELT